MCRQRPCDDRSAKKRDELASFHRYLAAGQEVLSRGGHRSMPPIERITHLAGAGGCCTAGFQSTLCLRWVMSGNALMEHMFSGPPPKADISEARQDFRLVARGDLGGDYSMTWSARNARPVGKSKPMAFAALMFTTNSKRLGRSTGISAGLVP